MNPNAHKNLRPWKPGESGNPSGLPGRPARAKLTEAFVSDLSVTWGKHGKRVLEELAVKQPQQFAALAAKLVPQDVTVSLQQRPPGSLSPEDWGSMLELLGAIRAALPDDQRKPGEIAQFVQDAIRSHSATLIDGQIEHGPIAQIGGAADN